MLLGILVLKLSEKWWCPFHFINFEFQNFNLFVEEEMFGIVFGPLLPSHRAKEDGHKRKGLHFNPLLLVCINLNTKSFFKT